jgi:hypothetical protein
MTGGKMDRKTLEQNYQKSFGASPAAELEQNYQRSGIDSLVQSVKKATQYNPSSPSTQPTQAAPAGASSSKQSDAMKEQLDAIKKQRDDAAIKAGAYMRAGNMPQQAKEQQKIANKAAIEYENAYTQWKNQRNAEAVEDYNPDENKFKAGDAVLSGVQNAFQSMRQYAAAASSYLSGNPEAQAWEAKALMDSGVSGTEAVKRAGLADKREIPITDYKTQAELRHEKNVASVGAVEGGALQLVNTISNMVPSLVANAILPGSGLPVMAASVAGNKYADAYEKYGNTDTAFVLGTAAGGASMLTEQFGGLYGSLGKSAAGQAVAKKLMTEAPGLYNLANSVGGKWLRDALSEGIEEGAEDVINYAIEKALTGDSDEMDNFGYDMLLGALAGGVFGGGNAAMRSVTYSRVGKALNASPAAVAQQVQEGMEKGAGTAPAIYAAEVQKNPSNQMVGRLYEANLTYDAESGLSKIQNDITQVSINEIKAMVSKADALAQAAQKLNVEATPQAVATAITDAQRTQSIKTAEDSVGQSFAPTVDNPANAGEKAYNSALAGVAANQGVAARINNDPAARQAFSQLTGVQFSGNTAQDIAAIEVATQNIAKSGKQAISQAEYAQRVAAAGEQAAAQFDVDMQAQAEQMQRESEERWLSVEQNTITDVDGKRRIKEITNTDVRGNTEIGYKKAEIPGSKKKAVAEVNNAAKYLGKTIVWFEGAVQVNGQYRLTNGYRAPDGTIYVNINSRDPLMVTFGHEMFHDLVADSKYSGLIDTLVENPDYADMVKGMMNAKTELYERNGIELDPNAAAEEVAADISGDLLGSRDMLEYIGARNTEAATGIKGFLNRILKKLKGKPSAQEAYNRLSESQRALIDGMEARSDAEEAGKISYSVMDAAVKGNNRPFAEQFADYKAGKMRPTDLFYLNNTSEYLQAAGLANEPIVMAQSVVTKAQRKATVDTHGHELSDDVILKLPEMIEKPVLLLKSDTVPNSSVVVTSVSDSSGNPVVVALHLSRNNGFDVVTRIASLYGKENSRNFIADQLIRGNLIGYSKKEANRLLHRDGLQLPRRNTAVDFDTISVAQDTDAVNNYSMQNSAEDASGKHSLMDIPAMDSEYSAAVESGNMQEAQRLVDEAAKENGYTIKAFHGTSRGDRVGNVFLPERATSGPMAFFTDNREIAERYSRDKADTSLAYDEEYSDYYTQFRVTRNGKSLSIGDLWKYLPMAERTKIKNAAPHIRFDEDYDKVIYDPAAQHGNGAYDAYELNRNKGNVLNTLVSTWLETGDLYNREADFLDVLRLVGLNDVEYRDPDARHEKVYETYLKIRNPFDASNVEQTFYDGLSAWLKSTDISEYERESAGADTWDKNSVEPEQFLERVASDIEAGTSHAWTSIPDYVTAYLKELGYDGIKDTGGKGGGESHTVWIPFSSEQVKSAEPIVYDDAGNVIPLSERFNNSNSDIRYSLMDTDSDGRKLSAEQREYFFGSKVVDADGRLKPVYHGSPAVFTEFSTDFMSQHGSSEGQGFYFTDYKPMAEGYQKDGGQLLEGYLDIKKPLSDSEITLTRAEVKKLLQAVDPTGDEVLVNYDPAGGIGYPSKTWYNRALDATVKAAMDYSSSDSEILAEIANGGAGAGAVLEAARNTLGYDGYIVEGKYDNATVYVAFDSSQFKNIDNTAPTESKDIRYSLMEDAQYMADIDRVVSEATEKANDELEAAQAEVKNIRQQLADYRQQATAEAKMNYRWRDAETKLLTEIAAAKEREKAAKARAEFMAKYDALAKQYRADLRANNLQMRDKYNEKLSEAKDEFNRRRTQDRIDRVVREDRAKSKARLRTAEQKSTTTEDVAKVLTEMPKKDKETFKAKAAKDWRTFKRQWINTKDELERFGNEVGDSRIMYAANNVGQASAAAQYSIGGAGQYDLNGKKIGDKNLMQVFEPAKKAGLTDEFYTYLLHEHNVDRMSVREKAQQQLAELRAKLNREVNGFAEMTDENIATAAGKDTTLTKVYPEAQIAAAKQYKQFQAWAEKQFDKPVFGSSVTADDSRAAAADLLDAHPEFEKWAKDVYAYLDGLMEVRKQGGLVSADMAQYMKELYPHYVPTYRDMPSTSGGYSNPNSVAVNSTIKSAKGGNQDIMPLIDSIARQTLQTFSAAKKNILGNMLYEDAMDTTRDISEYIQSVTEEGDLVDLDADSAENLKNTLRIWVDGKPVTLHMSEAMADGFRPIEQSISFGMKALRSINSTFKKLVTQWNPVFIVRNFVRDAQSALYFTHYSNATFIKNYGKAVKEIATNGKYWQLYQAMGGKGTTYYDPKTGLSDRHHFKNGAVDKVAGGLNRVIDILSFANEAVEQYPRLAEFISTMEDTGDVQQALYNAADITTNFGRGGFAARKLNASLVPFFNPGMQGLSKNIRNVIDRRGWKEIGQLISRLLINGVAPGIIMGLLYDGLKEDDDYKELSNYIKDSNILIKIGDNKFIKVPMGREPSVITAFTNRMWRWLKGEPASSAFAGYPSFAIEQIAPNNPLTNNIFAGITAMSTNKTWYGGDIVSSYMEEKPDYLQYDESTDAFSIWLGEITRHGKNGIEGLSPKKVNYLIDQYSGFIGDWLLPTLSKKADVPAVVKAFVVDSVRQNRLGSDFYDALDEAKQVKETEFATAADDATFSYLYKQSKAASEITKQLKEIYNSGEKTRKEKMSEARDLLELRNEIYRKALLTVGTYEETAKSIGSADSDVVKREANRKAFGAEYALKTYNKDVGEKAAEYVAQGVTYDQYYAAYFAARGIVGDKGENGKTITNSASRKKKEAIDKAVPNATTKQKHLLYEALGVSDRVW